MPDDFSSIFRREPPTNIQAEQAFLGGLLANNKVHDRALFLEPRHFSHPAHARIFYEARRLIEQRRLADSVTLKSALETADEMIDVGGPGYLSTLLAAMVGIINAREYAKAVQLTWMRRELIDIGETLVNEAFGAGAAVDPLELAARTIAMIDAVVSGSGPEDRGVLLDAAIDSALDAMDRAERGYTAGISTGFPSLDARLGGLEPELVYTLAGRPGSGKSSLGHQIGINAARIGKEQGFGVLELSLEMSATQLGRRALAAASGVPLFVMKRGIAAPWQKDMVAQAKDEIRGLPLVIDDTAGQTTRQIAAKCRAAKRRFGRLGLVLLDHLNLTKAEDGDAKHGPTFATEKAAGAMLQIAKDCNVPVLLLSQLNRGVEGREDKRPALADLRQSGAIEENSYAVGFLYREEYYLQNPPEETGEGGASDKRAKDRYAAWQERKVRAEGKAEVIWAKVRDGEVGTDLLRFDGKTTSFSEAL